MLIFIQYKNSAHILAALNTVLEETSSPEMSTALIETINELEKEVRAADDRKEKLGRKV